MKNSLPTKLLNPLAGLLNELIIDGVVVKSRISTGQAKVLATLFDLGVLREEQRGPGWIVIVDNLESLKRFVNKKFPSGLMGENDASEGKRTQSLSRFGDTKVISGLDFEFVILRAFDKAKVMATAKNGYLVHAIELTKKAGCFGLTLNDTKEAEDLPRIIGNVATVEGPELFYRFDWDSLGIDVAILTYGRMSDRLCKWVTSASIEGQVTHFGDYDPVGLDEYQKMKRKNDNINFYIPPDLKGYFEDKSLVKPSLMEKNIAVLERLAKSKDPAIKFVIDLMRKHGGGLEQEFMLIKQSIVKTRQA